MLKKLFILLLPLGTIAVVVWLVLPEYHAMQEAKVMRGEAEQSLKDKQDLIAKIKDLEEQYRGVSDFADKVGEIVPLRPNIPDLLVEIPELVAQQGMILDDLSFNVKDGSDDAAQLTDTQGSNPYKAMEANLQLEGSYEGLKIFLAALEKELRLMDVQALHFSVPQGGDAGELVKFMLSVRMYFGLQT